MDENLLSLGQVLFQGGTMADAFNLLGLFVGYHRGAVDPPSHEVQPFTSDPEVPPQDIDRKPPQVPAALDAELCQVLLHLGSYAAKIPDRYLFQHVCDLM